MTEQLHPDDSTLSERYSRATAAYYQKDPSPEHKVPVPEEIETAEQIAHLANAALMGIKQLNLPIEVEDAFIDHTVETVETFHAQSVDAPNEFDAHARQTKAYTDAHPKLLFGEDYDPEQFTPEATEKFKTKQAFDLMMKEF